MSRGPHNTKQADIRKAVNGVIEGLGEHRMDLKVLRVEVERGGKIVVIAAKSSTAPEARTEAA
ncbi:hypothetical protein AB7M17_007331 [Bradyrhizobium sp. USDA 377]